MSTYITAIRATSGALAAMALLLLVAAPVQSVVTNPKGLVVVQDMPAPVEMAVPQRETSLDPGLTIVGGSTSQRTRLSLAVSRFGAAGLELPDLQIVFSADAGACRGHYGLYEDNSPEPLVTLCSEADFVYEHELAHAWEAHLATDDQRQAFMDLRGYEVWTSGDVAWNDRGIEGAAFIVQQTIGGLPLPNVLNDEYKSRSAAFEALTGIRDPRLPRLGFLALG